jgi:hypothetical protein
VRPYVAFGGGVLRSNVTAFTRADSETYPFVRFVDGHQYDTRTLGIVEVGGGHHAEGAPREGPV